MGISNSVVAQVLQSCDRQRAQMYFKSSLTALSHAMEDLVLTDSDSPLIIACFQRERFYRQEAHRYRRIARKTNQVYVLAAPETEFKNCSDVYETVAFEPSDALAEEWHLVVIGNRYTACLVCHEKTQPETATMSDSFIDSERRFEGIWTFDPTVSRRAASILLDRIAIYRPELQAKIELAYRLYITLEDTQAPTGLVSNSPLTNPDPFVQRLVTYLQAGQYKLLKANKSLAAKQQKERLLNSVIDAVRRSLDMTEILQIAVQKIGEELAVCRCIIYRCRETDNVAKIEREFVSEEIPSVLGKIWQLKNNPLFEEAIAERKTVSADDTRQDTRLTQQAWERGTGEQLQNIVENYQIVSWVIVPIFYQDRLLGALELHHCQEPPVVWQEDDLALVDAIATQVGIALIQAEAYTNLEDLNEQLEALDRTRSNLVAITGHELRTPLSTIQVCLESLAAEPDMDPKLRQVMLDTALDDAERLRNLVQDFLTLSRLESGRVEWNLETLSIVECVELAVSNVKARNSDRALPTIEPLTSKNLPLVQTDGEWLVEVLAKLLDNACKFTNPDGKITIAVKSNGSNHLEVTVSDTGRGIEPKRLETVFDRFYQEEGALRRSAGGTGLGLAICRQIVHNWGGEIWAESLGKDRGSKFHFTIPIAVKTSNLDDGRSSARKKPGKTPKRRKKA
ncbi:DICT sensory domain-containing protein [Myxosarcina sp. GI1]|uniref:DICT sensory domain-containing protein n=1 Tax=Myxosarcina sp. GI1 TaxID=1541065 RepID=UPI00055FAD3D|nr:DICT sensory domain-containing protein [Myxosarcina sp. GI1]